MIRLFIFCLLVSIGYIPSVIAYGVVEDPPPVEKRTQKKIKKKKKARRYKTKKIKKTEKMKNSSMFFAVSLVWSIGALTMSLIGLALGYTTLIYIMIAIFLIAALTCLIAGYIYKAKENENQNDLGGEKKGSKQDLGG